MSADGQYRRGQPVLICSIGKKGIVQEKIRPDLYKIAVGNMLVSCRSKDLRAATVPGKPKIQAPAVTIARSLPKPRATGAIDLHGLRVQEALARAEQAINDAILDDLTQIEIIHGIGEGKIMRALHDYLPRLSVVRRFSGDPLNPGVTRVFL